MLDTNKLYLFISAALLLNITPGADMLYVIARSFSNGIKGGIVSSLGIAVGCLIHNFTGSLRFICTYIQFKSCV